MAWWRGDDRAHGNPKLLAVGLDGIGLFWQAVSWSSAHGTDGFVPEYVVPSLAPGVVPKALSAIVRRLTVVSPGQENPLWHVDDGGYRIHDFLDLNPSASEVEAAREQRREAGRVGGSRSAAKRAASAGRKQT